MIDRSLRNACLVAILLGAGLQLYFLGRGFYSISWDEAGRTLDAYFWAQHGRGLSTDWLPFYRVVVGAALQVFPDLVITPRIISGLFGLASIPAAGWVANELFQDRRTTLVTLAAGAVFSQRIALSLAPLSCIIFTLFVLCGMALFTRWLRTGRWPVLYAGAISIAIAGTVRYEGWLFAAGILGAIGIRSWRPNRRHLLALGLILLTFPAAVVAYKAFTFSNPIATIVNDARQYSTAEILRRNPMVEFTASNCFSLNLAGIMLLVPLFRRGDHLYRYFVAVSFGTLVIVSLALLVVLAAQTGPSWRMIAVWSMLLLPFTAHLLARLERRRYLGRQLAAGATALLLVAFIHDIFRIEREAGWAFPESDRAAGAYIQRIVEAQPTTRVMIESSEYFYLNVLVASQNPDAFVLSPSPRIDRDDIALLLFRTPEHLRFLELQTELIKLRQFGPWSLYCFAGESCAAQASYEVNLPGFCGKKIGPP